MAGELQDAADTLRAFALVLPEAEEAFPWGERVVKVNKKVFVFFGLIEDLDRQNILRADYIVAGRLGSGGLPELGHGQRGERECRGPSNLGRKTPVARDRGLHD